MSPPLTTTARCGCSLSPNDDTVYKDTKSSDRNCSHCGGSNNSILRSSSSAASLLSFDSVPVQYYDKRLRIIHAAIKGFTIGTGIKGGLALFSILARFRRRRSLSLVKKIGMTTGGEDIILAIKETLRYGLFLGTYAGTFVSVDELIAAVGGHHSKVESFASRSNSWAFNASNWTRN